MAETPGEDGGEQTYKMTETDHFNGGMTTQKTYEPSELNNWQKTKNGEERRQVLSIAMSHNVLEKLMNELPTYLSYCWSIPKYPCYCYD